MHLAVVGATGRTGRQVVLQALSRGHTVTAVARRPEALGLRDDRLTLVAADVLDPGALLDPLAGAGAVVSTLGVGTSRAPTTVYSQGMTNVLHAMQANGVRRLSVISAAPAGPRDEQPFLERRLLMPVLDRVFGATYEDMRRMEALLQASDVDWTALRPPRLVDKPGTGRYRLDRQKPLARSRSLTFADLATALLDSLDSETLYRRAAYVAN
jgi:putative NADH-flavin reductase